MTENERKIIANALRAAQASVALLTKVANVAPDNVRQDIEAVNVYLDSASKNLIAAEVG